MKLNVCSAMLNNIPLRFQRSIYIPVLYTYEAGGARPKIIKMRAQTYPFWVQS